MDRADRLHLMTTFRTHCQNGGGVYDFIQQSPQRISGEVLEALVAEYCSRVRDPHCVADVLDDLLQFPQGPVQRMVLECGFKILAGRMVKTPELLTPWFCYMLSTYDVNSTSTLRMLLADTTKWQAARHYMLNAPQNKRPGLEDVVLSILVRNVWAVPEAFIDLIPHLTHLKSPQIYSAYLKNRPESFNKPGVVEVMLNALSVPDRAMYFLYGAPGNRAFLGSYYRNHWHEIFPEAIRLTQNIPQQKIPQRGWEALFIVTHITREVLYTNAQHGIDMNDLGTLLHTVDSLDPSFFTTRFGMKIVHLLNDLRSKHQQALLYDAVRNHTPDLVGKRKI